MTNETATFAQFGVAVSAVLTFASEWDSRTMQAIGDVAAAYGIPAALHDADQLRAAAEANAVDLRLYGDESPRLTFTQELNPERAADVAQARQAWHDTAAAANEGEADTTDELDAAAAYAEALENYAGIHAR